VRVYEYTISQKQTKPGLHTRLCLGSKIISMPGLAVCYQYFREDDALNFERHRKVMRFLLGGFEISHLWGSSHHRIHQTSSLGRPLIPAIPIMLISQMKVKNESDDENRLNSFNTSVKIINEAILNTERLTRETLFGVPLNFVHHEPARHPNHVCNWSLRTGHLRLI
jgi:hypothetical protein